MEESKPLIQRRACERISTNIGIRFFFGNIFYSGVITNLSREGMFIRTMINLPVGLLFPIIIRKDGEVLSVLASVKHQKKTSDYNNGIGAETINSSPMYLEFVNKVLSTGGLLPSTKK